jgi:hypothetical protein
MLFRRIFSSESAKAWVALLVPFIAIAVEPVARAIQDGDWEWNRIWTALGVGLGTAVLVWVTRNKPSVLPPAPPVVNRPLDQGV